MRDAPRLTVSVVAALCALVALPIHHRSQRPLVDRPGFAAAARELVRLADEGPLFTVVWPPTLADAMSALPPSLRVADAVPDAETRGGTRLALIGPAGFATPPELDGVDASPRTRFDATEVAVFRYPAFDTAIFDLRRDLGQTAVSLVGPDERLRCDELRPDGGFGCPGRPEWNHVGPAVVRVDGNDWPGVWAHPVQDRDLVIDLGSRQLGDAVELEAALSDSAALTQGGAAVQLELNVEGVARRVLQRSNAPGVARLVVETPRRVAPITLTVRTGRDARRHLAINLRIINHASEGRETAP